MSALVNAFIIRDARHIVPACSVRFRRIGHVVLFPEIPEETPEISNLLKPDTLPNYSHLDIETCINAVGRQVINYEVEVSRLEEKLQDGSQAKTFDVIMQPIEKVSVPLDKAFSTLKHFYMIKGNEKSSEAYNKLHLRVQKAKFQRFQSLPIFHAVKELKADEDRLSEAQRRTIDKYLLEARLSGMELSGNQLGHFHTVLSKLKEHKTKYRNKIDIATRQFSHLIEDPSVIKDLPDETLSLMAHDRTDPHRGPWTVTLNPYVYPSFMEHCEDRLVRYHTWRAFNSRGSLVKKKLNCSVEIEEIRSLRHDQAKLLGYDTFADMSMETKMAGNVENVMSMIVTMHTKSQHETKREIAELQEFAIKNGFAETLQVWDIPYWRRKQRSLLYSVDEAQLRQYFPLPTVLKGLFNLCKDLFGITIKDKTSDIDVWNDDVKYYEIYDKTDRRLASFYLDPYPREGKLYGSWMEVGQNRSDIMRAFPISYLIFSFPRPFSSMPSLLSFENVTSLFQKFGHVLQHSLTTAEYSEVAGLNNLEWDVVDVCPHFMVHWLYDYGTIAKISGHVNTGQPIPKEIHEKLHKARIHMAGYDLSERLYRSAVDIELYSRKNFWLEISRRLWTEFMPVPFDKEDFHICSFREIICDEFAASYFSNVWSEMIAADLFSAFWEAGLNNTEQIKEISQRFHDTYLSLGGACHPGEVFRQFRGRDPSPGALLKIYNLKKPTPTKEQVAQM